MIRPVMTRAMRGQPGLVYIVTSGPPLLIIPALMQDEDPKISGGYAVWEEIQRRERKSLTDFTGTAPYRLPIPLKFDGFANNESIEPNIRAIEHLGRPEGGHGNVQPPTFNVHIPGGVPRKKTFDWVCENIEWGANARRQSDGQHTRQDFIINALEFVDPDTIDIEKRVPELKTWIYKTKDADTLRKIAKHQLGDAKRWAEIKKLNPKFRDPNNTITTNTSLKMPPKQKKRT